MRNPLRVACLLAAILVDGCVAQRVVWSPDGTQAAILGDDGLHLCDVSGKLSSLLVPDVKCVAWLPDSKRVMVSTQREFKTWAEASQAFPEEAAAASKNVDTVHAELLAASHGWSIFIDDAKKQLALTNMQLTMALMNLRDSTKSTATLTAKLDHEGQKAFAELAIVEDAIQIYAVSHAGATAEALLYRRPNAGNGVQSLRVSPTGDAVLISSSEQGPSENEQEPLKLLLVPTDGSGKSCEVGRGAEYPDWSPDGKYVIYITPADWKENQMQIMVGILVRQQVADESGHFIDAEHLPGREDLAGFLYNQLQRVRVAKDGRIFFDAVEISLPAAAKDFDLQPTVFCFDPGKQSTLTRVVPRSAMQTLGNAAQYFELSPDARYLSIPFDDGRVSILDIATGEAQVVQAVAEPDSQNSIKLASVPLWRTATELAFVRPISNSKGHEVVRYCVPDKKATVISADWPASVGDWVAAKEPMTTSPAAVPAQK
ncbi:MAG TPA: hypothetical protein VFE46_17020 [Pirellulales bacterium]|jgi:hypothetical protein|nr:hypothetical protein [Pirellulales bacterium]